MNPVDQESSSPALGSDQTRASWRATALGSLWALLIVGIWIPLLCTAPQILGNRLWSMYGFETDLPLRQLVRVCLNSLAVVTFILVTRRTRLFAFQKPKRSGLFLLFIPLMGLNILEGPLTQAGVAFILVSFTSAMLTGFWEEFLFRGVIQERLGKTLGPRVTLFVTAVLFALIHVNEGLAPVLIALGIGLAFCVARQTLGLWPLVVIHGTIDVTAAIFVRQWTSFYVLACVVVGVYGLVALGILIRGKPLHKAAVSA